MNIAPAAAGGRQRDECPSYVTLHIRSDRSVAPCRTRAMSQHGVIPGGPPDRVWPFRGGAGSPRPLPCVRAGGRNGLLRRSRAGQWWARKTAVCRTGPVWRWAWLIGRWTGRSARPRERASQGQSAAREAPTRCRVAAPPWP